MLDRLRMAPLVLSLRAAGSGGADEGAPGPRGWAPNAYAAYARDLDGNKLAAYCFKAA
ncbi:lactoylglutathione lyase-like lyase [Pseudomonas sp. G5(2012)]|nr:lactoylglutathione lyase-like lyase [Pseudomonas sp. G5(2012)]